MNSMLKLFSCVLLLGLSSFTLAAPLSLTTTIYNNSGSPVSISLKENLDNLVLSNNFTSPQIIKDGNQLTFTAKLANAAGPGDGKILVNDGKGSFCLINLQLDSGAYTYEAIIRDPENKLNCLSSSTGFTSYAVRIPSADSLLPEKGVR